MRLPGLGWESVTGLTPDEVGAGVEGGGRKRKWAERKEPKPGEKLERAKCGRVKVS